MQIALRERNSDASFAEGFIHGEIKIALDRKTAFDVFDTDAQFEIQRTVAEVHKQRPWCRRATIGNDLGMFASRTLQNVADLFNIGSVGDADVQDQPAIGVA